MDISADGGDGGASVLDHRPNLGHRPQHRSQLRRVLLDGNVVRDLARSPGPDLDALVGLEAEIVIVPEGVARAFRNPEFARGLAKPYGLILPRGECQTSSAALLRLLELDVRLQEQRHQSHLIVAREIL